MSKQSIGSRREAIDPKSDIAIQVRDLHKTFQLPTERAWGLKQAIFNRLKGVKGFTEQKVLDGINLEVKKDVEYKQTLSQSTYKYFGNIKNGAPYNEKLKQEIYDNILIIINERNYKIKDVHKLKYKGKTIYEYKIILNKYFSNRCFKQHLFFMKPASCEYFQIFVKLCNRFCKN